MISRGRLYLQSAPHVSLFPGIAISIVVVAVNVLSRGGETFSTHEQPASNQHDIVPVTSLERR